MAEAVRQVATSAILVSHHTVVIHNANVALQQDREWQHYRAVPTYERSTYKARVRLGEGLVVTR